MGFTFENNLGFFGTIGLVLSIGWYILQLVARWKIFEKAGEAGWKGIVPLYGSYIQYKLTWNTSKFWTVVILVLVGGCLNSFMDGFLFRLIAGIMAFAAWVIECPLANNKLSKSFGHGTGFTIGLLFLESIFMLILGFGDSKYVGNTTE